MGRSSNLPTAVFVLGWLCSATEAVYVIDDSPGTGRTFDGIGAISGGGATSKLLVNYTEPYRSQILDYLFKPNFAASLQILKVEIGGDSQSTDGAEASHMHSEDDENYERGYEWWMMQEAKKRNPNIKLYGLPWVFPGWLGGDKFNPYSNRTNLVRYVTNWVRGAQKVHNLTIDYVGIWNERAYDDQYIKMLRQSLISQGFGHVQIVAVDSDWRVVSDLKNDTDLQKAVGIIGAHYPGSKSTPDAVQLKMPLWASEEYSAYNDLAGGGCWARVLNEGYVNGYLTANIAWNLITSYYNNLPYPKSSLMTANEPWSGHYEIQSPIWQTAHHTQFTEIGWKYLLYGNGVGNLTSNGTYTTRVSPDGKNITINIVTLDPSQAHCFYSFPKYTIAAQTAEFQLKGSFASITQLNVFYSKLEFGGTTSSTLFVKKDPIKVVNGTFSMKLDVNEVYTLTTLTSSGNKGSYSPPPPSALFPVPYQDDFESYPEHGEPYYFAQQAGTFEVVKTSDPTHKQVIQQMVPRPPVDTCLPKRMTRPITLIGNYNWTDVSVQVDFSIPNGSQGASGIFLALRVDKGGCNIMYSDGLYLWILPQHKATMLTANYSRSLVIAASEADVKPGKWYTLKLAVKGNAVTAYLNDQELVNAPVTPIPSNNGFVAMGTDNFAVAYFDNFKILSAKVAAHPQKEQYSYNKWENRIRENNVIV